MSDVIYNISSGFFDSVNGDRLYSAADMNKPYKRVIADGIFPTPQGTPSTDFQVVAVSGMSVAVLAGNAMIGARWAENTDDVGITIAGNSSSSPRIDSIFLHIDTGMDTRAAGVIYRQGTAAGTPTAPAMVQTDNITELRLADILVAPSAAIITQANITDQRGGSDCPWVAGLIQQVDTSALFDQYRAAYAEQQQEQTDEWKTFMDHLARDYDISMSLRKHESTYTSTAAASLIPINIDGYDTTKDLLQVYINGIFAVEGTHYIVKSAAQIQLTNAISAGQKVHFVIYKAVMGGAQPIIPTDEQVQDAVDAYMDAHPGALVVDPELSDTSTHAIQNKAVAEALADVNGRLDQYEDVFTSDVDESVQNWLDEHPEATTTVQDRSLTFAKLVNGTLGFVTPEMYGAVGNGSADDTQAIRDAVDSGHPIYFDKSYAVTGEITVSGSCVLIGNPKGYIKQTTNNTNLFIISGNDVTVDSLHLIGVGTDYQPTAGGKPAPYGIAIRGQADARLKRIKIVNCVVEKFSHADISVVYADDVTIESNTVVGTGVDGAMSLNDNYQFGIQAGNCSGLRIVGNDVSYTAQGLYLGKNIYDLIVNGNTIHDIPGQHGIYSTFANGYMLTNNTFRNIALAGCKIQHDDQITEDSRNILIQGNLFDTVGQQAFMTATVETTPTYLFTGVNVLGNMFYNCEVGVLAARCRDIKIADNVYIGATKKTAGISLGICQQISIQNNRIINSDNGIYARMNATISEIVMSGNVLKNAGVSFSGATSVTDLIYINNISDSVGGFPNQIIIGKNKNKNLYYAPDTAIDTGAYNAGDMVLFNNAQSFGYVGAIKNATGGWAFLGNCLEHIKYVFSESGTDYWTINSFSAHSEGEHKLIITWSITCNVRGTAKSIGSFAGIPSGLLPDSNLYLSTSGDDGYGLYINAQGQVAASGGTVNATYTKTVTLVDGAISQ